MQWKFYNDIILESAECEMWHAILSLTVLYICQEVFCQ